MGNIKEINIKNQTYCLLNDLINIKDFDSNQIKIGRKLYKNITIYYTRYVTVNDDLNIHSVNLPYLIYNEVDGYIKEINGNKYLVFFSTDKNKEILAKYTELWNKIKDTIEEIDGKPCNFKKGVIKIKFGLDDDLCSEKLIKLHSVTIVFGFAFEEDDKHYPQIYLDQFCYELYKCYI